MNTTRELYREFILDVYRNPLNKKLLSKHDAMHTEYNRSCGDVISIQLSVNKENKIVDIGYQGTGCAIAEAATSLITEQVKGMDKVEVLSLALTDVEAELGISIDYTREKCAMIGLKAIQHAIRLI